VSRRKREPDAHTLLRFIADHESLALTAEEFPDLGEERIRALLRGLAEEARTPARVEAPADEPTLAPAGRGHARVVLQTDGASRGNPGPAGAGWVLASPAGEVIARGAAFLGRRTNNEAEYEAVIRGLRAALDLGADEVALRADSELLIKQLNGQYQVRNERIAALHSQARGLIRELRRFEAKHVRRELNQAADEMANHAIDEQM